MFRFAIPAEAIRGFEAYLRDIEPEGGKPSALYYLLWISGSLDPATIHPSADNLGTWLPVFEAANRRPLDGCHEGSPHLALT